MESPFVFGNKTVNVNCERHGNNLPSLEYSVHDNVFIRVCFMCYAEKQTQGLVNHAKNTTN